MGASLWTWQRTSRDVARFVTYSDMLLRAAFLMSWWSMRRRSCGCVFLQHVLFLLLNNFCSLSSILHGIMATVSMSSWTCAALAHLASIQSVFWMKSAQKILISKLLESDSIRRFSNQSPASVTDGAVGSSWRGPLYQLIKPLSFRGAFYVTSSKEAYFQR